MRCIHINDLRPGMKLAKTLYDENTGTILLRSDIEIQSFIIKRIKDLGYEYISIREENDADPTAKLDPVREETRAKSLKIVKDTMSRLVKDTDKIGTDKIDRIVDEIINQILRDRLLSLDLVQIRNLNNFLFMHMVNVGVIAILIGSKFRLGQNQLEMLGIGAMLHDIGIVPVDPAIMNKPGKLTPEEYEIIKTHPKGGFDILKTRTSLSFLSAHIAYQHHEREDGSGYPRGLRSDQIHLFAKITAVADTFDAMTSPRCFREAKSVATALEELDHHSGTKYDAEVVYFMNRILSQQAKR